MNFIYSILQFLGWYRPVVVVNPSYTRLVPKKIQYMARKMERGTDTREYLEFLGFIIIEDWDQDPIFYEVKAPEGWGKYHIDSSHISIKDSEGRERFVQFFKGNFEDREAYLILSD